MPAGTRVGLDIGCQQGRERGHDRGRILDARAKTPRVAVVGFADIVTVRPVDTTVSSACRYSHNGTGRGKLHLRIAIPQRLLAAQAIPDIGEYIRRHPASVKLDGPDLQGRSRVDLFRRESRGGVEGRDDTDLTRFRRGVSNERRSARRRRGRWR